MGSNGHPSKPSRVPKEEMMSRKDTLHSLEGSSANTSHIEDRSADKSIQQSISERKLYIFMHSKYHSATVRKGSGRFY